MKTHIIKNDVVINTIVATVEEAQSAFPDAICIDGSVGGIGWLWDGETLSKPPAPEPAPVSAPTKEELLAQLQALQAQIQALG
jgi:hypothetical protein